jgi:hypothetical protein
VEPEGLPGESIADRAELAGQSFAEVVLEQPRRVLSKVAAGLRLWGLRVRRFALLDAVRSPFQLAPVPFHGEQKIGQLTLEGVALGWRSDGPELLYEANQDGLHGEMPGV